MTWTRAYLKENAKQVLKWSYWNALLVCFLAELLGGAAGGGGGSASFHYSSGTSGTGGGELPAEIVVLMVVIAVIFLLAVAAFQVFVTNPVQVGKRRYFIANRQRRGETGQLFSLFRKGMYLNVVKVMFLRDLYTFLWSLLFVVPGVIKGYEYSMIPYLLAENPNLDAERAFQISKAMTSEEKLDMWVLDLSFIGWRLLGILACCMGLYFVFPYIEATWAELYAVLKYKGISAGAAHPDELGGQQGYVGEPPRPSYPGAWRACGPQSWAPQWQAGYGHPPYPGYPDRGPAPTSPSPVPQPGPAFYAPPPMTGRPPEAAQGAPAPAVEAAEGPKAPPPAAPESFSAPVYEKPAYEKPVYEKPNDLQPSCGAERAETPPVLGDEPAEERKLQDRAEE
ncbi:MAG: DUF975 family protein [Oscillospiraceae bacterium]|nr:DUF975 family protein [Oscillospiraceae bacterium]